MTQKNIEKLIAMSSYFTGMLHSELIMIRNDLHMADTKAALAKINDALKLMEEKVGDVLHGHEKTSSE